VIERLRRFGRLIKVEHTLFALPFTLASMLLAARGWPRPATTGWILLALVAGRSLGMAANRVVDRHVDRKNPRTKDRELPSGQLSIIEVLVFMAVCAGLLLLAVTRLPPLCMNLLPIALVLLIGYSYTKFFTAASHFVLGAVLATPVVGSRIAITGVWEWDSVWLALAVMLWVSGFDILYACQDIEFDRRLGLHSIPARLGAAASLNLALALHTGVVPALALFGYRQGLSRAYYGGLSVMVAILVWEHSICAGGDLVRVEKAFFEANVLVSLTFRATCALCVLV
jgi:4-hydroxybenzoate polyprenyltransferase